MKAYSINADNASVKELDITMEANTVYTFFDSILIDELNTLNAHQIHTDANALSNKKEAYFLGEQLLIGEALIIGQKGLTEADASIKQDELASLISKNVSQFYKETLALLALTDINLYRTFTLEKGTEKMSLNVEWVLYAFNMADEKTQEYFLEHLKNALDNKQNIEKYMHKMASLAINVAQ